jgi:hypothetical protein
LFQIHLQEVPVRSNELRNYAGRESGNRVS